MENAEYFDGKIQISSIFDSSLHSQKALIENQGQKYNVAIDIGYVSITKYLF